MMLQYLILKQPQPQPLVLLSPNPGILFPTDPQGSTVVKSQARGRGGAVQSIALQIWAVKMVNV